jgi:hypothetical protein
VTDETWDGRISPVGHENDNNPCPNPNRNIGLISKRTATTAADTALPLLKAYSSAYDLTQLALGSIEATWIHRKARNFNEV